MNLQVADKSDGCFTQVVVLGVPGHPDLEQGLRLTVVLIVGRLVLQHHRQHLHQVSEKAWILLQSCYHSYLVYAELHNKRNHQYSHSCSYYNNSYSLNDSKYNKQERDWRDFHRDDKLVITKVVVQHQTKIKIIL